MRYMDKEEEIFMQTVKTLKDLMNNADRFDEYLGNEKFKEFAEDLLRKDSCFLSVKKDTMFRFYPSCFLVYKDNSCDKHISHDEKEETEICKIITEIVKYDPDSFNELEFEYCNYCEKLGFEPNKTTLSGVRRQYWRTNNFEFNGPYSYWNTNRISI